MEGAGWEGRAEGGRRMGSHLWNRSDSLHRMTQPSSSLEKLTREEVSLRMEKFFRKA